MNGWEFAERNNGPFDEKACLVIGIRICVNCGLDTITISKRGIRCSNCGYFKLHCEE